MEDWKEYYCYLGLFYLLQWPLSLVGVIDDDFFFLLREGGSGENTSNCVLEVVIYESKRLVGKVFEAH